MGGDALEAIVIEHRAQSGGIELRLKRLDGGDLYGAVPDLGDALERCGDIRRGGQVVAECVKLNSELGHVSILPSKRIQYERRDSWN